MFSSKSKDKSASKNGVATTSSTGSVSVLTAGTIVEGNLNTEVDLRLEGTVKGEVNISGKVVLGQSGKVEGVLQAAEAVIHGHVVGNLFIDGLLHLASTAIIEGDISASQFSVEEGAVYRGKCNIGKST